MNLAFIKWLLQDPNLVKLIEKGRDAVNRKATAVGQDTELHPWSSQFHEYLSIITYLI